MNVETTRFAMENNPEGGNTISLDFTLGNGDTMRFTSHLQAYSNRTVDELQGEVLRLAQRRIASILESLQST